MYVRLLQWKIFRIGWTAMSSDIDNDDTNKH